MDQPHDDIDITLATNSFINKLHKNGYWQTIMFSIIEQSIMYTGVFIAFSGTFTTASVNFICDVPTKSVMFDSKDKQCAVWNRRTNKSENCTHGYTFHSDADFVQTSIKADFQLVCDRRYLDGMAQSCVMAGFFVGGILGPLAGDKVGRRYVTFVAFLLAGVLGIALGFVNDIYVFMAGNLLLGIMREVTMSVGFVYGLEFIPNHNQSMYGMITQLMWSLNIMLLGVLAYFFRQWRHLQIVGSIPILLCGFFLLVVPESPRWLIVNGQFEKLQNLVNNYANKVNKTKFDSSEIVVLKNSYSKHCNTSSSYKSAAKYGPMDIIRSKVLFLWTIILILGWMFVVLSYYGLTMLSVNFNRNKYVSFILSAVMEAPCILLIFFIIHRGRNVTFFCLSLITAISVITVGFLDPKYSTAILILSVVGKGSLASMFYVIVVTSVYIYPTTMRSFGTGLPSALGKLFAVLIPYFVKLYDVYVWLPTLIIGVSACFIGTINVLFPDWINEPFPETIRDLDLLKKRIGFRLKCSKTKKFSISK